MYSTCTVHAKCTVQTVHAVWELGAVHILRDKVVGSHSIKTLLKKHYFRGNFFYFKS